MHDVVQTTLKESTKGMIEWGVVGCVLAFVLVACLALVVWVLRASKAEVKSAWDYAKLVNEQRAESAKEATAALVETNINLKRVIEMQNAILTLFRVEVGDDPKNHPEDGRDPE